MLKVAFLHDVEMDYQGGAELSNKRIIDEAIKLGHDIHYDSLADFEHTKALLQSVDVAIINNLVHCNYQLPLINYIIEQAIPYVRWEHDYGLCAKRSIYCYIDHRVTNCCDNDTFHTYRNLFANAILNVFQSPLHYDKHHRIYGETVSKHIILPPPISVENLKPSKEKNTDEVVFVGDLKFIKGGHALLDYAVEHPEKSIVVYGNSELEREIPENVLLKGLAPNSNILEALGKAEYFFFKPVWFEPSGRVAAEAFLSGAKILGNDKVGTFSYDFYPDDKALAKQQIQNAPHYFWQEVENALHKKARTPKLKHVLIYKNYGGLGDRFIVIPAIKKLAKVCEKLTYGVPKNLVSTLEKHLKGINIVAIDDYDAIDTSPYDQIINLGNYPKSRRFDNKGVIEYETHNKLKQHSLKHYIDAVATFHPEVNNTYDGYPYFKANTNTEEPYFCVHPGAGFSPKWWATDRYVDLIKILLKKFPNYKCQVVLGPDDPDPKFFKDIDRVTIETGNLDAVETCVSGAMFHIGNDSGITHFAGVFNVPSVSFHGLTGPGAWATMAEQTEVIWGKPGNCNIHCKYDTAMSCEHRNCLNSITVNRALEAVCKLLQKSLDMSNKRIKYVFNPEVKLDKVKQGFVLHVKNKELLLEFKETEELKEFTHLVQHDLFEDEITQASLKPLIKALINENLVFAIPL